MLASKIRHQRNHECRPAAVYVCVYSICVSTKFRTCCETTASAAAAGTREQERHYEVRRIDNVNVGSETHEGICGKMCCLPQRRLLQRIIFFSRKRESVWQKGKRRGNLSQCILNENQTRNEISVICNFNACTIQRRSLCLCVCVYTRRRQALKNYLNSRM